MIAASPSRSDYLITHKNRIGYGQSKYRLVAICCRQDTFDCDVFLNLREFGVG